MATDSNRRALQDYLVEHDEGYLAQVGAVAPAGA